MENKKDAIKSFKGKDVAFLSNFYSVIVKYNGIEFPSVEHAFQASKCLDENVQRQFRIIPTPGEAKRFGKKVKLREDWEIVKVSIMEDLLKQKFSQKELKNKLLETGNLELIEGNNHGDTFWGQVNGQGENMLGKLLMKIRDEIREDTVPRIRG